MSPLFVITLLVLLVVLTLAAYVDRVYSEMGKFLAREYQDNIDAWEQVVEPRFHLGRESVALSASVLRQLSLGAIALLSGLRLYTGAVHMPAFALAPSLSQVFRAAFELILLILIFDRLVPQILFSRTRGLWIAKIIYLLEVLFYLVLPVTLLLGLLLSIAALAEPEDEQEAEHPSEAMDALLEAGEEEGILEESDRELVRSVVEFGDKVVREVMTPRPEIFAVPGTLTLQQFTAQLDEHAFSRVPVYTGSLDSITGIAFAHDLLQILDIDAQTITVAAVQRPAAFVPETKKVAELLREMQREKQHMRIVIDEYGGVAGLVTIEDLLEAIVGNIADEHDEPEDDDTPIREENGAYTVSGSFELSRLRDLFADQFEHPIRPDEDGKQDPDEDEGREDRDTRDDPTALRLPEHYESTTLGGLVSEIAGHIPLPGEVVEEDGLRLEVLASTDRRIDRIRVSLAAPQNPD
ncbi:hemolysin family protein [Granulicella arctica]|uniref:CBS domain containing-hemolysin-like protein n=1 Tax=Granulicella arctica TaxID=940613 RepID=A0A7Y9PD36_9BACT|nr:hemolysin family protein [Granulicella arctica]NYF77720.1 CBS domain containing-hemolysin-like protein [Granulicella arctica]